eukprot:scaffold1184_cov132-Cylindrotheca_fusiformis.AAC.14
MSSNFGGRIRSDSPPVIVFVGQGTEHSLSTIDTLQYLFDRTVRTGNQPKLVYGTEQPHD